MGHCEWQSDAEGGRVKNLVRVLALFLLCVPLGLTITGCSSRTTAPPLVSTNDATEITIEQAILNGDLTALGSTPNVDVSFQWGTESESYLNETVAATITDTGAFSSKITGLELDTTYYYRAKAVGDGTSYGSEKSLKTPALVTKDASHIVLNIGDLGTGWTQNIGQYITSTTVGAQSAYEANFISFSNNLNTKVSVYPSVALAREAYSDAIPTNLSLTHPSVGDECFLSGSQQAHQNLVFRKLNVVVWVSIDSGDAVDYAMKVEAKIP
jgi:hypothetical protein